MSMANSIAVMNAGRVEQLGTAAELYENPRTEFVASFLGVSNLIAGRLGDANGRFAAFHAHDGARLLVPRERLDGRGGALKAGVRPEKISLLPAGETPPSESNVLRGRLDVANFLGVSIQYVVRAAGGEELTVFAPNREGAAPEGVGVGREVQLVWEPRHTFVVTEGEEPPDE